MNFKILKFRYYLGFFDICKHSTLVLMLQYTFTLRLGKRGKSSNSLDLSILTTLVKSNCINLSVMIMVQNSTIQCISSMNFVMYLLSSRCRPRHCRLVAASATLSSICRQTYVLIFLKFWLLIYESSKNDSYSRLRKSIKVDQSKRRDEISFVQCKKLKVYILSIIINYLFNNTWKQTIWYGRQNMFLEFINKLANDLFSTIDISDFIIRVKLNPNEMSGCLQNNLFN